MAGAGLGVLCRSGGWTHGVLWLIDRRDTRLLLLEESYHKENNGRIFEKMINQVHVIGQGTIGEVAACGQKRWINFHAQYMQSREISASKDYTDWQHQILAGIKTIAVISLPGLGVILFGSTQKICESPNFIAQAQHLLRRHGMKQIQYDHVDWNLNHPEATFASVISSPDSSSFKNNILHDSIHSQRLNNISSIYNQSLVSGLASPGSQIGTRYQTSSLNSYVSSTPVVSTSSGSFNGLCDLVRGSPSTTSISSHQLTNQQTPSREARMLSPLNNEGLHSNFKCLSSSFSTFSNSNIQAKLIESSSSMEHDPFNGIPMPGILNMVPTSSHPPTPCSDSFDIQCENSILSHCKVEPHRMLDGVFHCAGDLLEIKHCSSPPISVCSISTGISSSKHPPDIYIENSAMSNTTSESETHHIHDKPIKNCILSREQRDDWVNNGLACGMTAAFHDSLSEIHNACDSFFLDRGCNWSLSASHTPAQLVSDNDKFDGMEVDLSPMILMQECPDDIILPVFSNSCIDFSASISDCLSEFEMGSVAYASKDLLSESITDVVVPATCNVSSSCNSGVTVTDSVANISSSNQIPTLSYPEWRTENITGELPKDVQRNSLVHSWIDDSCSVNAQGSVAKVIRKRSRRGESTRPRPKDRQQIQDRVKDLRGIVPNGAKCSIDALLERTISHMIFLQNVMKYTDKLKQADGPKIVDEDNGVVLKDNINGGLDGATWAYEVAGQTMVCPILVDDLHPSGQMLVEMLCEERGLFLEIADTVRGFGLTILKGTMETRGRRIWARFFVEANRDVTRMDIFLSLVHLLQQTSSIRSCELQDKAIDTGIPALASHQQSTSGIPIGLLECS